MGPSSSASQAQAIGELAIECAWDKARRQSYTDRYKLAVQLDSEANGEMFTRWLLTQDQNYQLPEGVNHADIFVAYNSEQITMEEIPREKLMGYEVNDESQIGVLIAHGLQVPDIEDKEAIGLSKIES